MIKELNAYQMKVSISVPRTEVALREWNAWKIQRKVRTRVSCAPGGARGARCVALSIVARTYTSKCLREVRRGCRRKEGKPRNKAVAPVTLERASKRVRRIINARVLLVAHKSAHARCVETSAFFRFSHGGKKNKYSENVFINQKRKKECKCVWEIYLLRTRSLQICTKS